MPDRGPIKFEDVDPDDFPYGDAREAPGPDRDHPPPHPGFNGEMPPDAGANRQVPPPRSGAKGTGRTDGARERFTLIPFDQIRLSRRRRYLIDGIIPREGLVTVWGPPKSGKTFWIFDAAMHIAMAWSYRGRRTAQGPVVYICLEGEHGIGARKAAFEQQKLPDDHDPVPFYLMPTKLDLVEDVGELVERIEAQLGEAAPVVVVIDTLNRSLAGSESSDEDMSNYVKAVDVIKERFHCTVAIVHHCGLDEKRPRGHTSLVGADDAQIKVFKSDDGLITTTVEYMKDGESGATTRSRLQVVELGSDEDGAPITSCVIEAADDEGQDGPGTPGTPRRKQPAPLALKFHGALTDALAATAMPRPESASRPCVTLDQWKAECCRLGLLATEPGKDLSHAQKSLFNKYRRELIAANMIACNGDFAWDTAPARRKQAAAAGSLI